MGLHAAVLAFLDEHDLVHTSARYSREKFKAIIWDITSLLYSSTSLGNLLDFVRSEAQRFFLLNPGAELVLLLDITKHLPWEKSRERKRRRENDHFCEAVLPTCFARDTILTPTVVRDDTTRDGMARWLNERLKATDRYGCNLTLHLTDRLWKAEGDKERQCPSPCTGEADVAAVFHLKRLQKEGVSEILVRTIDSDSIGILLLAQEAMPDVRIRLWMPRRLQERVLCGTHLVSDEAAKVVCLRRLLDRVMAAERGGHSFGFRISWQRFCSKG